MTNRVVSILLGVALCVSLSAFTYPIVDTGVHVYYSNSAIITVPMEGDAFYGQDACYQGNEPTYTDNGDGTITDNVTGMMWQKNMGEKLSYYDAFAKADTLTLGGYTDWRMPTLKELYSLMKYTGQSSGEGSIIMYIDTLYFDQPLGSPRPIDAQTWSSNKYMGLTMQADSTVFGVNFVDGRIKGYPMYQPGSSTIAHTLYARMVRGNPEYGINSYVDNGDGTITDSATGLMWQQADDGISRDWQNSLAYAENLVFAGYSDWRLPNAKELQSIVDYTRCPDTTQSPAIDPIFATSEINDPDGNPGQYPYFWSSTSHLDGPNPFTRAVYVAFGEAQGKMNGVLLDVHGAGAQRSDPKTGNPTAYPQFLGPQGDVLYVFNYARCVRNAITVGNNDATQSPEAMLFVSAYPNPLPVTGEVTFETKLKANETGSISIYNVKGQKVKSFEVTAVNSKQRWNGTDENNNQCAAGIYLYKLSVGNHDLTKKLMIVK